VSPVSAPLLLSLITIPIQRDRIRHWRHVTPKLTATTRMAVEQNNSIYTERIAARRSGNHDDDEDEDMEETQEGAKNGSSDIFWAQVSDFLTERVASNEWGPNLNSARWNQYVVFMIRSQC
jgi:hypothetical protein